MSFLGKTEVEVMDSTGKTKIVHISKVRNVLSVDRVVSKFLDYQSFGRQS